MTINKFFIFAERCSGTHFLEQAFFENFHIDRKRYNCSAKQFRAVYCLYNNSDGTFISKDLKCTPNKIEIPTIENSLMIIESEELVHRVHFTKGKNMFYKPIINTIFY